MTWALINIVSALIVAAIVVYKLSGYYDTFTWGERIGMGGTATFMVLRLGPILGRTAIPGDSPFDDWTVAGLHISLAVFFVSRLVRLNRHWVRNNQAKRQAVTHLHARGKL